MKLCRHSRYQSVSWITSAHSQKATTVLHTYTQLSVRSDCRFHCFANIQHCQQSVVAFSRHVYLFKCAYPGAGVQYSDVLRDCERLRTQKVPVVNLSDQRNNPPIVICDTTYFLLKLQNHVR